MMVELEYFGFNNVKLVVLIQLLLNLLLHHFNLKINKNMRNQQIGWSQETKLIWLIAKKIERLIQVAGSNITTTTTTTAP
jgi:hypothetical protein